MSDAEVLWLNVTNAILGILVLLPVLALLIAVIVDIGKSARRRCVLHIRLHLNFHRLAHIGAPR